MAISLVLYLGGYLSGVDGGTIFGDGVFWLIVALDSSEMVVVWRKRRKLQKSKLPMQANEVVNPSACENATVRASTSKEERAIQNEGTRVRRTETPNYLSCLRISPLKSVHLFQDLHSASFSTLSPCRKVANEGITD